MRVAAAAGRRSTASLPGPVAPSPVFEVGGSDGIAAPLVARNTSVQHTVPISLGEGDDSDSEQEEGALTRVCGGIPARLCVFDLCGVAQRQEGFCCSGVSSCR